MSDSESKSIAADYIRIDQIRPKSDDDVILVCGDLVPDDIDMNPRMIGTREAPFRDVVAESLSGSLDPLHERDCIGAHRPFFSIRAHDIYGNFHGSFHGLPFPGTIGGYGWLLVLAETTADGVTARVQRAMWPSRCWNVVQENGKNPHVLVHPDMPFIPFVENSPVFAEFVRHEICSAGTVTSSRPLMPQMNGDLKLAQVDIEIDIPRQVSGQYQILIRLY